MGQTKHILGPKHPFVTYEINRSGQEQDFGQSQMDDSVRVGFHSESGFLASNWP